MFNWLIDIALACCNHIEYAGWGATILLVPITNYTTITTYTAPVKMNEEINKKTINNLTIK
jgi:hypothetical protein